MPAAPEGITSASGLDSQAYPDTLLRLSGIRSNQSLSSSKPQAICFHFPGEREGVEIWFHLGFPSLGDALLSIKHRLQCDQRSVGGPSPPFETKFIAWAMAAGQLVAWESMVLGARGASEQHPPSWHKAWSSSLAEALGCSTDSLLQSYGWRLSTWVTGCLVRGVCHLHAG